MPNEAYFPCIVQQSFALARRFPRLDICLTCGFLALLAFLGLAKDFGVGTILSRPWHPCASMNRKDHRAFL